MAKIQGKAIRFKVPWMGKPRGHIDRTLAPGIMQTMVDYHRAEWYSDEPPRRRKEKAVESETLTGAVK